VEATLTMFAVAASELDERAFADWIRRHIRPR
jgi:prophage maintenance system killer protein